MSLLDREHQKTEPEAEGPEVLRREVSVEIEEGSDGRTLISRLVPYNEVATVSDDGVTTYQEMFLPGAFAKQMRAASRIKAFLNFRHRQSLADVIGHATKIADAEDGLHGELRVLNVPDGDKALELVRAGELDKLSIEFQPVKDRVVNGVVQRVSARLLGIALTPEGAYSGAEILAIREAEQANDDDDGEDGEVVERPGADLADPLPPAPTMTPVAQMARIPPLPTQMAAELKRFGLRVEPKEKHQ